jgi:hypothetical protein
LVTVARGGRSRVRLGPCLTRPGLPGPGPGASHRRCSGSPVPGPAKSRQRAGAGTPSPSLAASRRRPYNSGTWTEAHCGSQAGLRQVPVSLPPSLLPFSLANLPPPPLSLFLSHCLSSVTHPLSRCPESQRRSLSAPLSPSREAPLRPGVHGFCGRGAVAVAGERLIMGCSGVRPGAGSGSGSGLRRPLQGRPRALGRAL